MPDTVIAGRYRLDELLGRGGMSEVWRAVDEELGRPVAIKLLAPDADTARFEREARAFASLGHPNVTQLYDYGEEGGRPYMVLEYLPGGTLEDRLRDGKPLPDDETFAIAGGIAAGLAHAHGRGVVHRDLKPSNVLFDAEGRPKIADFGIARMAAGEGTLTEAGTVLGTAAYISPEQATGQPASSASDVYSFGVMLYRMLTGRLPFDATDPMQLVIQHRDELPPPIGTIRGDAPAVLESTATAALAKDPRARPPDGSALLAELGVPAGTGVTTATTILAGDATQVLPAPPAPAPAGVSESAPLVPPPERSRVPLIVAAILVLAVAGAALAYAVTRPSSAPGNTGTFSPVTLPSESKTTSTTAPTTTSAPTESTTTEATSTAPTTTAPTTTGAPAPTTAPVPTTAPLPPTTTALPTTTAPLPTTDTGGATTIP
jgi:eukaryotic-like serine/threonine-protein kinase